MFHRISTLKCKELGLQIKPIDPETIQSLRAGRYASFASAAEHPHLQQRSILRKSRWKALESVARLLTFAVLALPFPLALFWLPPDSSPPARMRCGHLACHLGSSSVRESRDGRPEPSPLPETRFLQMPWQAGRANPRDRYSRAG